VTIHDMLPVLHPEFFTVETRRQFQRMLGSLQPSDHVLCVSESTRHDVLNHVRSSGLPIPERQVHVTPLAASPALQPLRDPLQGQILRQRLGLDPEDRVILSLSTLEPRKNLQTLLTAFERLHGRWEGSPLKLVLAGSEGWKIQPLLERLQSSTARQAILLPGHVPETDLPALLSLAELFVYPSLHEGFGLPPLEALQCGLPVIAGRTSSLPEVVGDAGILVDPCSSDAIGEAMACLLASPERRADLCRRGLDRARLFSWERTAELTIAVYERVLAEVPTGR
jgi:glycosyltransferase involved in cell wall biosynthesis